MLYDWVKSMETDPSSALSSLVIMDMLLLVSIFFWRFECACLKHIILETLKVWLL